MASGDPSWLGVEMALLKSGARKVCPYRPNWNNHRFGTATGARVGNSKLLLSCLHEEG